MNTFFTENKKTLSAIIIGVGILLGIFLLVATFYKLKAYRYVGSGRPAGNTITVIGYGKIDRAPDTAKVSFTIRNEARDLKTAQTNVSQKIDVITKALADAGIDKDAIKTISYTSYPQYNYTTRCVAPDCPPMGTPVFRGYEVSHAITINVKALDKVETVLGILGTNNVSDLSGPNFGFEDDKAIAREARALAIDDAKEEAKNLARSLGVDLVRIVSFNEEGTGGIVPQYDRAMAVSATVSGKSTPSVPVGTQNITATVSVVYEIR